ncbi:non-ribosomal peptide synthetase [Streptomyces sp. NPDC054765]
MNHPFDSSCTAVLNDVVAGGCALSVADGRLRLTGPASAVNGQLRQTVVERRDDLVAQLGPHRAVPVSGIQRRLWFLQQLDPFGTGYTFSYVHRLTGALDPRRLERAVNAVVAAQPGLRAGFLDGTGSPIQLIENDVTVSLPVLSESAETAERTDGIRKGHDEALGRLRAELVRPFDLARPPLLRSALLPLGHDEWLWGVTYHHLISDGWTHGRFLDGVSEAYRADGPAPRPEADYPEYVALDVAEAHNDPRRTANLAHWRDRLTGVQSGEVPPDRPRPTVRTHRGGRTDTSLGAETTHRLRELAVQERTTLFAVLLGVHATVLAAHTGQDQVVVGTPHANRPDERFHDTAGCFVSTLALPVDLSGDPTFRQVVARASEETATAWDHCDYSYEQLVEQLAPERDTSRNALFQTFLALQDAPARLELPAVTAEMLPFDSGVAQFELEFHLTPGDDGSLGLSLLHNRDLFTDETAHALLHRWRLAAEQLGARPSQSVHSLPLLTAEDLRTVNEANSTALRRPSDRADVLIREQARRSPDRVAVECGDERLTYRELEGKTAEMASRLRAAGGAGGRVGVALPRSVELVTALLATWRCGATALPLPLDLPAERVRMLAGESAMTHAWTVDATGAHLPSAVRRLDARPAGPRPGTCEREPEGRRTVDTPDDIPAYILFTSGSTGKPKGVAVGHHALVNLLTSMTDAPGLTAGDTLVAVTAPFFDIALLELLAPLLTGGRLVVATDDETHDPQLLAQRLRTADADVMQATPSTWQMLLETGWEGRPSLTAWCGGEPLSRDLADQLLTRCAGVWNLYGPTETTIWSSRCQVLPGPHPVLIGRPVGNTTLHVLTPHGTPLPPGPAGELYIAGDGLAEGYLGQPELTARRFVTVLDENGRKRRAYRTGDIVQRRDDGALRYVGREDHQLKVRGHRLEPEEIEHALRTHPAVLDSVVLLAEGDLLVAHVQADPGAVEELDSATLAAHAATALRPALIPQHFVLHDQLPRTPNGKTDRMALARTPLPEEERHVHFEAPRTEEESLVADVYQQVLGRGEVGRTDDFFCSGGHSLVAVRVLHLIEEASGVRIPLHVFMRDATVATVAALLPQVAGAQDEALAEALAALDSLTDEEAEALLRE